VTRKREPGAETPPRFPSWACLQRLTNKEDEVTAANRIRSVGPGDVVKTVGRRQGDPGRTGEIVAVLGEGEHVHYLVRWEDGHESILYPGEGTTISANAFAAGSAD